MGDKIFDKGDADNALTISAVTSEDSSSTDRSEQTTSNKRQTWASQIDFIMSAVGCAVGLGNIWRFPYLCYKNGGGAFLIPYFVLYFLVAIPTFILEISLGQYTSSGSFTAWTIVPAFQGVGFASQVITGWANIYYIVVIAWALYYLVISFTSELPWSTCGNAWNSDRCFVTGMSLNKTGMYNCSNVITNVTSGANCTTYNTTSYKPVDAVVEYWENGVLRTSSGIQEPGNIVPGLALSLLAIWVLVYLCICRGVRWTGKIVYFTAVFPYVLLTVLFFRGITLDGAVDGIVFYLKPDFSRLGDAQVWIDGGTQVMFSVGIAQGYMVTLGSYNEYRTNCVRNSLVIVAINCLTSIYGGLVVFSILGFMAKEINVPIATVVDSGPGLVFQAYPKAVTQMSMSPLWSVLFFLMILFVGLDSEFVAVEGFLTPILDRFPKQLYVTKNRMIFVGVYCIIGFCLGLTMVTEGGIYLFRVMDYYCASGLTLLIVCFFEVVAVGWIFGADRYYDVIEMMIGRRIGPWLKICWKFAAPVIVTGIFLFEVSTYKPLQFSPTKPYQYPDWALALGVLFILSSTMCIPAFFIYHFFTAQGTLKQRWNEITTPVLKKHQIAQSWHAHGYKWRQIEYEAHDVNNPCSDEINDCERNLTSEQF